MPYNNNSNLPVLILCPCPTCAHQHHLLFYSFEYVRLFCHSFVLLIQQEKSYFWICIYKRIFGMPILASGCFIVIRDHDVKSSSWLLQIEVHCLKMEPQSSKRNLISTLYLVEWVQFFLPVYIMCTYDTLYCTNWNLMQLLKHALTELSLSLSINLQFLCHHTILDLYSIGSVRSSH